MEKENIRIYFLYDEEGLEKEIIIPTIPETVSYSHNPNIATQQIIGRLTPINRYTRGGDEQYSFSVKIHNDLLINKELVNLVEEIKMLSYPVERQGIQTYPKIYFELGELSGTCIVDTNIQWEKPIVNGHYVLVNITFNLRIIKAIEAPSITILEGESGESLIKDKIYSGYTDEEYRNIVDRFNQRDYDTSIEDFVVGGYDEDLIELRTEAAVRRIDTQTTRLKELYSSLIGRADEGSKEYDFIENTFGWMESPTKGTEIIKDAKNLPKEVETYAVIAWALERKVFNKEYHEYSDLTSEQIEKAFNSIKDILVDILETRQEVIGYAARS